MPKSIQSIDEIILFFIQNNLKNPALDQVMVLITSLGNAGFLWIAIAFLLLLKKRYHVCGITLICAISLSMFLGDDILKPLIGRTRPCTKFPDVALLLHRMHSFSFPSGHTMVAFSSATVLHHYQRRFGIVAFGIASLIAFSRLYLFVHYPSDILGGILFGTLVSFIIIRCITLLLRNVKQN